MPREKPPLMLLILTVTPWWIEDYDDTVIDERETGCPEIDRALARVVAVIQGHMQRAKIPFETIAVDTHSITISVLFERVEQVQRIQEVAYAAREELDAMLVKCVRCKGGGVLVVQYGDPPIAQTMPCKDCNGSGLLEPKPSLDS